jgi:membrane-associated phospholipid phosphatase
VKSKGLASVIRFVCIVIALVCVAGRLYSGVHWLTDIVGGVLLSVTFLLLFAAAKGDGSDAAYDANGKPRKLSTVGYTPRH